jgi:hypothetical protein
MCGPDNFNPQEDKKGKSGGKGASQVKFLDLSKLTTAEYQAEGLVTCISWYLEVLDKQS